MFSKKLNNSEIKNILVINLSNIGDVVLTLPVIDTLKANFPEARLNVIVGPKAAELLADDAKINTIIYDKSIAIKSKIGFLIYLKKQKFDLIVDLRHSGLSVLLNAEHKTSPFKKIPETIEHMKYRYLYKLKSTYPLISRFYSLSEIHINESDKDKIEQILSKNKLSGKKNIVIVSPGAASRWKRYPENGFAKVCDYLTETYSVKIVMVGDKNDAEIAEKVSNLMKNDSVNLCGQTNLKQLAGLLKKAKLVISNDSAVMHLASYLEVPTLAIFGPTNPKKYGPWNSKSLLVRKELDCSPCEESSCRYNHECMNLFEENVIIKQAGKFFEIYLQEKRPIASQFSVYKRILVIRTDRIGDVLLSTPVIKAVKDFFPNSFLAVMVRPYAKEIIEGNPFVDELIIYDKYGKHKSILSSLKFANELRKERFDLAIILHPTNRVNLISFFAGIPERIGYNRKMGFFLTKKLDDKKYLGEKHEMGYSLDVIRALGIEPQDKTLFMPIKKESEDWVDRILKKNNALNSPNLVAIHPGASCPSKIWPQEHFSDLANRLIEEYRFKIIIISGPKDQKIAEKLIEKIEYPVIDLSGETTISKLASILKRCCLFISNDSGPVHISTAVGTPVISIFGRNQKGLSPLRWGPLGEKDIFLHKDVGCIECLAHNCKKEFICLKSISVEDVLEAVDEISKL
ncbi:MAG: lipopolysaccharide heptosyltransferase II [Candidatus Omnitrophota bacterium]